MEKLTSSDAWILQTIAHASKDKRASLQDIIAVGDALNHAIFSAGELQNGFYKLYQLNLIQQNDTYYSLTDAGKNLLHLIMDRNHNTDERTRENIWINQIKPLVS